jgi:predicted RNase H-like HicB family nuclease
VSLTVVSDSCKRLVYPTHVTEPRPEGSATTSAATSLTRFANSVAQHKPCENWSMERYATVIDQEPEGGFWAEVPALPGCYSQGETIDELTENVREAITSVLEVMKERGKRP